MVWHVGNRFTIPIDVEYAGARPAISPARPAARPPARVPGATDLPPPIMPVASLLHNPALAPTIAM